MFKKLMMLGVRSDIENYKKEPNKGFFKILISNNGFAGRWLYLPLLIRMFFVIVVCTVIISVLLKPFLTTRGVAELLAFIISYVIGYKYSNKQSQLILNEIIKIEAEDEINAAQSSKATIIINGIESEVFEEDIIEAIKNTDAKSILPYKKQLPYYNKITSKEEKDRLLMVFVSALVTSHNIVWNEKFYQDGESMIKKMPDVGTFSSLNKILDNKDLNEINTKNLTIIENQEKILFLISDAIHNIGNNYFKEKNGFEIKNEDVMEQIGFFFALTRRLSRYIKNEKYSNEEYSNILHFIETDFHEFCHYQSPTLDLEKYRKLIK